MNAPFNVYGATYEVPSYYIDASGVVHLQGLVAVSSGTTGLLTTLPVGARPNARLILRGYSQNTTNRIDVLPTGDVFVMVGAADSWFELSGVEFLATQ